MSDNDWLEPGSDMAPVQAAIHLDEAIRLEAEYAAADNGFTHKEEEAGIGFTQAAALIAQAAATLALVQATDRQTDVLKALAADVGEIQHQLTEIHLGVSMLAGRHKEAADGPQPHEDRPNVECWCGVVHFLKRENACGVCLLPVDHHRARYGGSVTDYRNPHRHEPTTLRTGRVVCVGCGYERENGLHLDADR